MKKQQSINLFVPAKAPSRRPQRVAQEIRFCLSQVFLREDWPILFDKQGESIKPPASITITEVSVSPDLKQATVWVMPLGGSFELETKIFLESIKGQLRKQLSNHLQLRATPNLHFEIDPSFKRMAHIDALLKIQ